jgi:membrane-associated phospholipid phosphatase
VAFAWATVISENYGIWYITYPVATMAAMARIYKNMHWASDVFAGAVIGTFFGKIIYSNNNSDVYLLTGFDEDTPGLMVNIKF